MDWSVIILLALVGVFFLWRSSKNEEKAKVASARLESDTKLYEHIKTGMREYNFREHEGQFWKARDGELLFDTAHVSAFHVDHFAETRVGFYFKDLQEYGLYGGFAGNGDEFHDSYYRTDRTFRKEEVLVTLDG
ncbi:hypothetical protein SAMN05216374_4041 [Tardiphaga sp. OK246]|jgi:hypothetical protein|uniref:hypothetical protein n=1 Tax=Tardiphaga sp. OK246 TaxID=1855307 RepID=UPI000B69D451|nr:hypothetical protein [Tardiphaga sp. OK246]SNT43098.1 hypothetical protein SAMN05216374_4041 [Tardiphaga sp. OK246]